MYSEIMTTSCSTSNLHLPALTSINDSWSPVWWLPNGDDLFPSFLLHLLVGIPLWGRSFPSLLFIDWLIYFLMAVWNYGLLFYSKDHNPLLSLLILIWSVGTPSSSRLYAWHVHTSHCTFPYLLAQLYVSRPAWIFPTAALALAISPSSPGSFYWRMVFRDQHLVLHVFSDTSVPLLWGPLSEQC